MRLQQRDAPEICLLSKEKILFLSNVCQGRCTQRPQNAFEFEFLIGRRRETLLFHGLSAEGAKAGVVISRLERRRRKGRCCYFMA